MADSPASSDLSDPPSGESDNEEQLSTAVPSSRPSVDITHTDHDHLAQPPAKRRRTGQALGTRLDRAPSSLPPDDDDNVSISSDNYSSAPGSPSHDEYTQREEAQTLCLWRDCAYGEAVNNDELVKHVQSTHCATGGPKRSKYVCEWGECQRKTSNHPSGYALKAHMRSHTKEKPYYCALPECDKAFTRSDALAKHMRTVHEPEAPRATNDPTPPGKKSVKLKLTNGSSSTPTSANKAFIDLAQQAPTHDEDGNPVDPSPPSDNIAYIPAHHPVTGQPGFMITYPPDIHFSAFESGIQADQLMRLLRRQLHWARKEGEELARECADLEKMKREEWSLKEILVDGVMESELERGDEEGLLDGIDVGIRELMERDIISARKLDWTGGEPSWRQNGHAPRADEMRTTNVETPVQQTWTAERTPSPPPTGKSGGFDGDADPYDNYLSDQMKLYEAAERNRSMHNTPQQVRKEQQAAEADAVGALIGMSGHA